LGFGFLVGGSKKKFVTFGRGLGFVNTVSRNIWLLHSTVAEIITKRRLHLAGSLSVQGR